MVMLPNGFTLATRAASDDQPSSAGVDELRRTLRETVPEEDPDKPKEGEKLVQAFLDKRSQVLRRQVTALQSIAELRQALALQEWGDNQTAVIDRRISASCCRWSIIAVALGRACARPCPSREG